MPAPIEQAWWRLYERWSNNEISDVEFKAAQTLLTKGHPIAEECPINECVVCSVRDCPHEDPLHHHHDGCPACAELGDAPIH